MSIKTEIALMQNLSSKMEQRFVEAASIWNQMVQDVSSFQSWDDPKRQELDNLIENVNDNFNLSLKKLKDYLIDFNKKMDELQNGTY